MCLAIYRRNLPMCLAIYRRNLPTRSMCLRFSGTGTKSFEPGLRLPVQSEY